MAPQILIIAGKSNSGKTTLMEKLIAELTSQGIAVGSVKHAHDGFELDQKGKDSWRHRQAGAAATLVATDARVAMVKNDRRPPVEKMLDYLGDVDLILAEGFKAQPLPKIEIFRKASPYPAPLFLEDPNLVGFVTDTDIRPDVPVFGPEDISSMADFILANFVLGQRSNPAKANMPGEGR
jgi:molybdopterin-guanine dinucleotide biosynthesis protein B